jgi:hypothetical protein
VVEGRRRIVIPREAKRSRGIHSTCRTARNTERRVSARRVVVVRSANGYETVATECHGIDTESMTARVGSRGDAEIAELTPVIPRGAKRSRGIHPDHQTPDRVAALLGLVYPTTSDTEPPASLGNADLPPNDRHR